MADNNILNKLSPKEDRERVGLYLKTELVDKLRLLIETKNFKKKGATISGVVEALIDMFFEDNNNILEKNKQEKSKKKS